MDGFQQMLKKVVSMFWKNSKENVNEREFVYKLLLNCSSVKTS